MSRPKLTVNLTSSVYKYHRDDIESGEHAYPTGICDIYQIIRYSEKAPVLLGYFWIFDNMPDLIQLVQPVNLDELNFIRAEMDSRKFPNKVLDVN